MQAVETGSTETREGTAPHGPSGLVIKRHATDALLLSLALIALLVLSTPVLRHLHTAGARAALLGLLAVAVALWTALTIARFRETQLVKEAAEAEERRARELERRVVERTDELGRLATHLQLIGENERAELARRLHDELGGLLTAAKMDLSWLQSRNEAPLAQQRLEQLGLVLDEAMDLKRRVVEQLRPSLLDHFGLATALRSYAESTARAAGLECRLDIPEHAEPIPADIGIVLFRVAEEGIANVLRHAQARVLSVRLGGGAAGYELVLSDDGRGFDTEVLRQGANGLVAMRHRLRSLGGELELSAAPGAGTQLRAFVPSAA